MSCIGFLSEVLCNFVPIKSPSAASACFSPAIRSPLAWGWYKHHQEFMIFSRTCCSSANPDKTDRHFPRSFKLGTQTWLICWRDGVGWPGQRGGKERKGRNKTFIRLQIWWLSIKLLLQNQFDSTHKVICKWFITIWQLTPGILVALHGSFELYVRI